MMQRKAGYCTRFIGNGQVAVVMIDAGGAEQIVSFHPDWKDAAQRAMTLTDDLLRTEKKQATGQVAGVSQQR